MENYEVIFYVVRWVVFPMLKIFLRWKKRKTKEKRVVYFYMKLLRFEMAVCVWIS